MEQLVLGIVHPSPCKETLRRVKNTEGQLEGFTKCGGECSFALFTTFRGGPVATRCDPEPQSPRSLNAFFHGKVLLEAGLDRDALAAGECVS
jgi:hypothetical protein